MAILFASSVRWTNEQGIDVILRLKNLKAYDVETERIPNRALWALLGYARITDFCHNLNFEGE